MWQVYLFLTICALGYFVILEWLFNLDFYDEYNSDLILDQAFVVVGVFLMSLCYALGFFLHHSTRIMLKLS